MAKYKKKAAKKQEKIAMLDSLPQNIVPIGERVEADKRIYISQRVYKEIHRFTKNKTTNESGGMLIGNVIEEFGKTNIIIQGFVEAKYSEGTPTTLKFTHETWEYVHSEIERRFENGQIVGWIHTHPDFGIFLSEYDKFIQDNFFKEENQIAYVVDPIQHIEGFYFWVNEKIERCKGFYIFDKTGEQITLEEESDSDIDNSKKSTRYSNSLLTYALAGALVLAVVVFAIISGNLMNRMTILERQQENLVESANQSIFYLQQQISGLETEISDLTQQIEAYHPTEETEAETVDNENIENTEEQHELTSDELREENFPENSGEKITEENENE